MRIFATVASGMSVNVRQAFLHYAENSSFEILRETAKIIGEREINFDLAPFCEPFEEQTKSR